jgi:hypothetical protein
MILKKLALTAMTVMISTNAFAATNTLTPTIVSRTPVPNDILVGNETSDPVAAAAVLQTLNSWWLSNFPTSDGLTPADYKFTTDIGKETQYREDYFPAPCGGGYGGGCGHYSSIPYTTYKPSATIELVNPSYLLEYVQLKVDGVNCDQMGSILLDSTVLNSLGFVGAFVNNDCSTDTTSNSSTESAVVVVARNIESDSK